MAQTETTFGKTDRSERSVTQLVRDFMSEVTALLRDEMKLARSEVSENISQLRSGLMFLALGALVLLAGFIELLNAAVIALTPYVPADAVWLSPLIVGAVVMLIGIAMLLGGRSKIEPQALAPTSTMEQSQRDQQMLKERLQ